MRGTLFVGLLLQVNQTNDLVFVQCQQDRLGILTPVGAEGINLWCATNPTAPVYTDYNISRRKINTDFLKAAVMLIRISNINMEIDIFGAEEIMWMPDVVAGEPFDESLDSGTGIALKEVLQWNIQL